ncbi:MAG: ParB/RepB/Spo0J family partition protein [Candidatus Omnitrophota bacterium]|nr:ParB/RepB/Spo0J family partition protein [Candidatus Omnitrophota bacterium]
MKKALGKGLSALIPDTYINSIRPQDKPRSGSQETSAAQVSGFQLIPITQIQRNQGQPRKHFAPEGIEELAASIKEKGVMQPILVKKDGETQYQLICGERRLRAALLCGLDAIPAVIKDVAREDFLEWALIENIQRQDLNPIEEAEAFKRLVEERTLSQDEVAKRVGKDRTTVANILRLLRLPEDIRDLISDGLLTAGHARAILGLLTPEHQRQMAKRIAEENLSVRQVEALVNRTVAHKRKAKRARHLSPEIVDLEMRLSQHFGTQVKIYPRKNMKQGRIEMQYFSLDDLDRILESIGLPEK